MHNRVRIFLIMCLVICAGFKSPHKFYTSITQMEYNPKTQSWEIIMNIFYDDFEKALENYYSKKIKIDDSQIDAYTKNYLEHQLGFFYKGKHLKYHYIGTELEKDVFKIYIEVKQKKPSEISIVNRVVIDVIDEQINIFNLKYADQRKSMIFQKDKEKNSCSFEIK